MSERDSFTRGEIGSLYATQDHLERVVNVVGGHQENLKSLNTLILRYGHELEVHSEESRARSSLLWWALIGFAAGYWFRQGDGGAGLVLAGFAVFFGVEAIVRLMKISRLRRNYPVGVGASDA